MTTNGITVAGWPTDRIAMGQVGEPGFNIQQTLSQFQGGGLNGSLDSLFFYTFDGTANATRDQLLTPNQLVTDGKSPYSLVSLAKSAGASAPTLVLYANDYSTQEDVRSNVDVNGATAPVTQLANLGLQSAAFQKANLIGKTSGTILFSPDGFGAMAKNLLANMDQAPWYPTSIGNAINPGTVDATTKTMTYASGTIFASDTTGQKKTTIDFASILKAAVDEIWSVKDSDGYAGNIFIPTEKPDPTKTTNGIEPINLTNDVTDYLAAQAWMVKQFSPYLSESTVLNPWTGPWAGTAAVKYNSWDGNEAEFVNRAATAYNALGFQKAAPYLDFIAFDKYERDETSYTAVNQKVDFNTSDWRRYLQFVNDVTTKIMPADKQAIMLYQMPAGSLPATGDSQMLAQGGYPSGGAADPSQPHFDVAEKLFFGQSNINNANNVNSAIANLPVNETASYFSIKADTYGQLLTNDPTWNSAPLIDTTTGAVDPLLSKVFAILWGGGDTATPISYRASQWTGIGSATTTADQLNVKNSLGTAVLNTAVDIAHYETAAKTVSVADGTTPAIQPWVVEELEAAVGHLIDLTPQAAPLPMAAPSGVAAAPVDPTAAMGTASVASLALTGNAALNDLVARLALAG